MLPSSSYTLSGEPSPISRGAAVHSAAGIGGPPSAHSSPLRPNMGSLLERSDMVAVHNSLAGMALQVHIVGG